MSINFATMQGLTIPEGVVTQIADASGRVIWSCSREKTLYLRPSADISLEHPVYPTTLTSGYLAISEEVADGATTYIGVKDAIDGVTHDYTSTFKMALSSSAKIRHVISAKFGISIVLDTMPSEQAKASCEYEVMVANQSVYDGCRLTQYLQGSGGEYSGLANADMPNFVTAINEFIDSNGVGALPEITVKVNTKSVSGTSSKNSSSSYVTQLYIELTCE